jgi:hypothetical protein
MFRQQRERFTTFKSWPKFKTEVCKSFSNQKSKENRIEKEKKIGKE